VLAVADHGEVLQVDAELVAAGVVPHQAASELPVVVFPEGDMDALHSARAVE